MFKERDSMLSRLLIPQVEQEGQLRVNLDRFYLNFIQGSPTESSTIKAVRVGAGLPLGIIVGAIKGVLVVNDLANSAVITLIRRLPIP